MAAMLHCHLSRASKPWCGHSQLACSPIRELILPLVQPPPGQCKPLHSRHFQVANLLLHLQHLNWSCRAKGPVLVQYHQGQTGSQSMTIFKFFALPFSMAMHMGMEHLKCSGQGLPKNLKKTQESSIKRCSRLWTGL